MKKIILSLILVFGIVFINISFANISFKKIKDIDNIKFFYSIEKFEKGFFKYTKDNKNYITDGVNIL